MVSAHLLILGVCLAYVSAMPNLQKRSSDKALVDLLQRVLMNKRTDTATSPMPPADATTAVGGTNPPRAKPEGGKGGDKGGMGPMKIEHYAMALLLYQACDVYAVGFPEEIPTMCWIMWEAGQKSKEDDATVSQEELNHFLPWGMCNLGYSLHELRTHVREEMADRVASEPVLQNTAELEAFEQFMAKICGPYVPSEPESDDESTGSD